MSPNSYCLRRPGGFDAGGEIARIVAAEAGLAQRAEQILQGFEAEKVERLVGDLELDLLVRALRRLTRCWLAGLVEVMWPSSTSF